MATSQGRAEPLLMTGSPKIRPLLHQPHASILEDRWAKELTLTSNPAALNPETLTPLEIGTSP